MLTHVQHNKVLFIKVQLTGRLKNYIAYIMRFLDKHSYIYLLVGWRKYRRLRDMSIKPISNRLALLHNATCVVRLTW